MADEMTLSVPRKAERQQTRRAILSGAAVTGLFSIIGTRAARAENVLRVADMNSIAFQGVLEVSGLGKDLPYRIEYARFPAGAPEMEAINAGAIDFGQVGDIPFLFGYAAGFPVRAVGAIGYKAAQLELVVQKGSNARSIQDLRGKRIAVNRGGGGHIFVLSLLERAGLKADAVQLVFLGPADAKPAFASAAVDAWAAWPPYSTLAKAQDGGIGIANLHDTDGYAGGTDYHIAHVDAIANKRALILDYQRRIYQARIWSLTHVDETAAVISRDTKLPLDLAKQIRIELEPRPVPLNASIVKSLQLSADLFARHGVIKPLNVDGAFDLSLGSNT